MKRKMYITAMLFVGILTSLVAQNDETVYLKDGSKMKGYIAEQTPGKTIGFVQEGSEESTVINWEDISYIGQDNIPITLLSGINSVVTLKSGDVIKGRITEIYPGSKIRIDNGSEERVCDFSYIESIAKEPINDKQSFAEQSKFSDVIYLKNKKKIKGFIINQSLGKSITVLTDNNKTKEVDLKDVVSLKREINDGYAPILDKILAKGQYQYEGSDVKFQTIDINPRGIYYIELNNPKSTVNALKVNAGQEIVIYANMVDNNAVILATKTTHYSEGSGKKALKFETFTTQDFVDKPVSVMKSEVSKAGTTKISFTPTEKGYYVLRVNGVDGFIVINAK